MILADFISAFIAMVFCPFEHGIVFPSRIQAGILEVKRMFVYAVLWKGELVCVCAPRVPYSVRC